MNSVDSEIFSMNNSQFPLSKVFYLEFEMHYKCMFSFLKSEMYYKRHTLGQKRWEIYSWFYGSVMIGSVLLKDRGEI